MGRLNALRLAVAAVLVSALMRIAVLASPRSAAAIASDSDDRLRWHFIPNEMFPRKATGQVANSPMFLGSHPAEVRAGDQNGTRVLGDEEDAGRTLVQSRSADQLKSAVINATAPTDIVTMNKNDITPLPEFDNTQNDGNHVHSVWRDFNGAFGRDILREHLAAVAH